MVRDGACVCTYFRETGTGYIQPYDVGRLFTGISCLGPHVFSMQFYYVQTRMSFSYILHFCSVTFCHSPCNWNASPRAFPYSRYNGNTPQCLPPTPAFLCNRIRAIMFPNTDTPSKPHVPTCVLLRGYASAGPRCECAKKTQIKLDRHRTQAKG